MPPVWHGPLAKRKTYDRFLTRDHGFYREYFKRLKIIDPSRS